MKIILKEEKGKKLNFDDVEEDQFFVNGQGWLCQKVNDNSYNVIANEDGDLLSARMDSPFVYKDGSVVRIIDSVERIEF